MNERSLDVLKQYSFDVNKYFRGRGGMILNTNVGLKILSECSKPDKYYERENMLTSAISENGYTYVDTYCKNEEGKIVTTGEDGRKYIVKDWFDGHECDVKNAIDVCESVNALGKLHLYLDQVTNSWESTKEICIQEVCATEPQLKTMYEKHTRELKMAGSYLRNKKKKSEFEILAMKNFNQFYEEAQKATRLVDSEELNKRFQDAKKKGELCHGSYNYHNVLLGGGSVAIANFDKYRNDCQIVDLYQFMRKILEKYDWNLSLAYKMMDEYDKVKSISDVDLELLTVLFTYPEKFWKVINYYFNSNKSWIPRKSIEKLENVVNQNPLREKFIDTIA